MKKQKKQILSLILFAGVVFTNRGYLPPKKLPPLKPVKPIQNPGNHFIRPLQLPDGIRVINNY